MISFLVLLRLGPYGMCGLNNSSWLLAEVPAKSAVASILPAAAVNADLRFLFGGVMGSGSMLASMRRFGSDCCSDVLSPRLTCVEVMEQLESANASLKAQKKRGSGGPVCTDLHKDNRVVQKQTSKTMTKQTLEIT